MLDIPFIGAPGFYYSQKEKMIMKSPSYPSPFDDSAISRQKRMGLLSSEGKPNIENIHILAHVYAALFFDRLCDTNADMNKCVAICEELSQLLQTGSARQLLLSICVQYDTLLTPLPEPIWWSVGNQEIIAPYVKEFVRQLSRLTKSLPVAKSQ
jgi:hypothetical protein